MLLQYNSRVLEMCSCTLVSGLFETYPGFDFISDTMSKWNLQQPLIQFPLCIFWWLVCRLRATVAHRGFPKKVDHLTPTSVHKHKVSQSTEVPLQTSVFYLNLLPIRAQVVDTEAKKNPSTHLQFHLCTFLPLLQRPAGRWSPSIESWLTTRVSISQLCLVHLQKRGVASFNTSNDLITLNKTRAGDDYSTD